MSIMKFKSKAAGDIVMYQQDAAELLRIMGITMDTRGVIEPENLTRCVADLVAAINQEKMALSAEAIAEEDLDPEERAEFKKRVTLAQRAWPLLKMMEAAASKSVDVHWGF